MAKNNEFVVISLGGSLIVPHLSDSGGIAVSFLRAFRSFLLQELKKGKRFIVVTGGGKTTRVYQKAASQIVRVNKEDLDWLGLHPTRLNAHLLRTIFTKEAYSVVIDHDPSFQEIAQLTAKKKNLFIAGGWRPGWSTDYVAVRLAQKFGAKEVINAGDTSFVYSQDPKKNKKAKPFKKLSWREYKALIPATWTPGMHVPFDPVATKLASKIGLEVKILKGTNLAEVKKAIEAKPFRGTLIHP
jgi:uridylate kinase